MSLVSVVVSMMVVVSMVVVVSMMVVGFLVSVSMVSVGTLISVWSVVVSGLVDVIVESSGWSVTVSTIKSVIFYVFFSFFLSVNQCATKMFIRRFQWNDLWEQLIPIEHVHDHEYLTMHYFGIPRDIRSIIAS